MQERITLAKAVGLTKQLSYASLQEQIVPLSDLLYLIIIVQ